MYCPTCGKEIEDGSLVCPICGAALEVESEQPVYQAAPAAAVEPKKKNIVLPIVVALVAIAAIAAVLIIFVFGGGNKDGKYVCEMYAAFGIDVYLEVDGDEFDLVMTYDANGDGTIGDDEKEEQEGTIKFDGDKVIMTAEGEDVEGSYDKDKKSITISQDGMSMEFVLK